MTVILFLVDNSPSMNQRTYFGPSFLDFCKASIETFYKIRTSKTRLDQYFISTLDTSPSFIKLAGWKQNDSRKLSQVLEKIKCTGSVSLEVGILRCFNLLNLNRLQLGFENYGFGLYPSYSEPAIVICVTHESSCINIQGLNCDIQNALLKNVPGEEFSQNVYRWDYRLFGLSLSIPGIVDNVKEFKHPSNGDAEDSVLSQLIRNTGGEKYFALDSRSLQVSLEKLSDKCQSGVVINFILGNAHMKQFAYVRQRGKIGSTWPFPDLSWFSDTIVTGTLTPRPVQPNVHVSMDAKESPEIKDYIPFDRYELEPSYLTKLILSKRDSESVWECSSAHPVNQTMYPFAFLRASSDLQTVHLYVLTFNYPHFLKLFNEVNLTAKISDIWMAKLQEYLNDIPRYYLIPLAKLFERIGLQNMIRQDFIDKILPYQIKHNLQKLRQTAKMEYERIVQIVENCIDERQQLLPQSTQIKIPLQNGNFIEINQINSYRYPLRQEIYHKVFFDPCEAPRGYLRELVCKMRKNLLSILESNSSIRSDNSNVFNQPISEMGDYINYKFRNKEQTIPTLREIYPSPERVDTFGNPFRKKSSQLNAAFIIDEGFVGDIALSSSSSPSKKKNQELNSHLIRTKGPIPSNMNVKNWRDWSKKFGRVSPYHNDSSSSPESCSPKICQTASKDSNDDVILDDHKTSQLIELVRKAETLIRSPTTDYASLFEILEKISRPYEANEDDLKYQNSASDSMLNFLTSVALLYSKTKLAELINRMKYASRSPLTSSNEIKIEIKSLDPETKPITKEPENNPPLVTGKSLKRKIPNAKKGNPVKPKLLILSPSNNLSLKTDKVCSEISLKSTYDTTTNSCPSLQRCHYQKTSVNGSH